MVAIVVIARVQYLGLVKTMSAASAVGATRMAGYVLEPPLLLLSQPTPLMLPSKVSRASPLAKLVAYELFITIALALIPYAFSR
jgi:hypothetical protein